MSNSPLCLPQANVLARHFGARLAVLFSCPFILRGFGNAVDNESCGGPAGNSGCSHTTSLEDAKKQCCGLGSKCVSVSVPTSGEGESCYKNNDDCGWKKNAAYQSLVKLEQGPPQPPPQGAKITASLKLVGWQGGKTAKVRDLWAHKDLGEQESLEAMVPPNGLALFRLSKP
eukprot:COSAG02_NODE_20247_length_841_cov_1.156334_1_plen_172_part_00